MNATGYKGTFKQRRKLDFLINLRMADIPYSIDSLSMVFSCDKKAIRHQCDRYMISPEAKPFSIMRLMEGVFKNEAETRWQVLDGERINKGHSYEFYLNKALRSPLYRKGDFYS